MADNSTIEWTDATWNPVTGCSVVSPGCTNCYAMGLAGTRLRNHPSRVGLTIASKAGPVWNGQVRLNEAWLTQPLKWQRPRRIFVCAHGDLFHEAVPDEWIDRVFAVMALAPQHTLQVLTKRSARMRDYMTAIKTPARIATSGLFQATAGFAAPQCLVFNATWPIPNVWLGVSAEDQHRADERVPDLLMTPAAVRFVSAEPLLGPVDFRKWLPGSYECSAECGFRSADAPRREVCHSCGQTSERFGEFCECGAQDFGAVCPNCESDAVQYHPDTTNLNWIVAGGESGPNARPMHPQWARDIRDQCAAAGVAFYFKQWGEHLPGELLPPVAGAEDTPWRRYPDGSQRWAVSELGTARSDMEKVRFIRAGKKRAGRLLDGVEHNGMPAVRS